MRTELGKHLLKEAIFCRGGLRKTSKFNDFVENLVHAQSVCSRPFLGAVVERVVHAAQKGLGSRLAMYVHAYVSIKL